MSKQFHVPIEITVLGSVCVEAEDQEAAYDIADKTMFWAYQAGDPAAHKDVSITYCQIKVEDEELDLYNDKWED